MQRSQGELDEQRLAVGRAEVRLQGVPESAVLVLIGFEDV
jgi:hypothetical protein